MATEALNRSSEASARLAMRWGPHIWKTLRLLFLALRDAGSPLHILNTDVVGAILYFILVDCGFGRLTIHSPQAPWAQLLSKRAGVATEPRRRPRVIAPGQRSLSWPLARRMRLRPPPRRSKSF